MSTMDKSGALPEALQEARELKEPEESKESRKSFGTPEAASGRIRPAHFVSDAKRAQAKALFEAGAGYRQAARILNLPLYTVRDWRRLFVQGAFRDHVEQRNYVFSEEVRRRAVEMRRGGATWREIEAATGAKPVSVRRWMRAAAKED